MSKVPKDTNTALTLAVNPMDLVPTAESMSEGFKEPSSGQFLPFIEMVFPIMITPEHPYYKGQDYKIGIKDGSGFTPLPAGTILTVVDKRNSARLKAKQPDGSTKPEYAYAEIERKGQKFNASAARYNELAGQARSNPDINDGYSMVTVVMLPDGRTLVGDLACYKTMTSYMYKPMAAANLAARLGVQIDLEDHSVNLKKSAGGFFYPDSKKFNQWKHIQLTPEQLTKAVEAINNVAESYMNWLNR